jgi:hypothetical protein
MTLNLRRLAGWALITGTVVGAAGYLAAYALTTTVTDPLWTALYSVALAGDILIVFGLPAILTAHGDRLPRLTLVGYIGIFGTMVILNIAEGSFEAYVRPYLATHGGDPAAVPSGLFWFEGVGLLFLVVGLICLGIAVIRAKVFGWWVGALFIASPLTGFVGLSGGLALISDYLAFIALMVIGVKTVRMRPGTIAAAPAPAPA